MKTSSLAVILANFLTGCAGTNVVQRDRLPASFPKSQTVAAVDASYRERLTDSDRRNGSPKLTRSHILAWQRTDTRNPHVDPYEYMDSCITWSEFRYPDGTERWHIVHLVSGRRGWEEQIVHDAPIPGSRTFARRPTNEDVVKFLKDTQWIAASVSTGSGIVEAGVCKRDWIAAIGVPPPMGLSFAERSEGNVSYY